MDRAKLKKKGPRAQPPDVADVLLHETATSWLEEAIYDSRPITPWEETPVELAQRIRAAAKFINDNHDVSGLCREFPDRLRDLQLTHKGDRLPK